MSPSCPSTLQEQQHHSVSNVQIPNLPASGFVSDLLSLQTLAVQPTATNATSHLLRALASAEFSVQLASVQVGVRDLSATTLPNFIHRQGLQRPGLHVEPPRKDFNFSPSTAAPAPPAISVVALAPSRASGFKFFTASSSGFAIKSCK